MVKMVNKFNIRHFFDNLKLTKDKTAKLMITKSLMKANSNGQTMYENESKKEHQKCEFRPTMQL